MFDLVGRFFLLIVIKLQVLDYVLKVLGFVREGFYLGLVILLFLILEYYLVTFEIYFPTIIYF